MPARPPDTLKFKHSITMESSHFSRNGSVFIFLSVPQQQAYFLCGFIILVCWRRADLQNECKAVFINCRRQWPKTIEIRINLRAPFDVRSQHLGRRCSQINVACLRRLANRFPETNAKCTFFHSVCPITFLCRR